MLKINVSAFHKIIQNPSCVWDLLLEYRLNKKNCFTKVAWFGLLYENMAKKVSFDHTTVILSLS